MFVPRYWSEASHRERLPARRQVTIRRFGWSAVSQAEADVHARRRVEEAVAALHAGGPDALKEFTRRERAVAYAGSDGLPIREEIVLERDDLDVVVTRNAYGARCLNTTRAMFVDVDEARSRLVEFGCLGGLVGLGLWGILLFWMWWWTEWSPYVTALVMVLGLGLLFGLLRGLAERRDLRTRDPARWALERCRAWCADRPDWRVAVYATPAGARILPVHAPFDAADPASFEFMAFVQADPLFQRMCRLQKCFRARVSAKPWRAGIEERFRAGGTWPVLDPRRLARRAAWVARYEQVARGFAACRFVELVGTGRADPRLETIRRLHDDLCQASSTLPLA